MQPQARVLLAVLAAAAVLTEFYAPVAWRWWAEIGVLLVAAMTMAVVFFKERHHAQTISSKELAERLMQDERDTGTPGGERR